MFGHQKSCDVSQVVFVIPGCPAFFESCEREITTLLNASLSATFSLVTPLVGCANVLGLIILPGILCHECRNFAPRGKRLWRNIPLLVVYFVHPSVSGWRLLQRRMRPLLVQRVWSCLVGIRLGLDK